MAYRGISYFLGLICPFLMLVIVTVTASEKHEEECLGPLAHYRSLNCTPVYRDGEYCAWQYNCDHLFERIRNKRRKCYFNGKEYKIGEELTQKDTTLCEPECFCGQTANGFAHFICTSVECPSYKYTRDNCHQRNPIRTCCGTEEVCINGTEKRRPVCKWDGKIYLDDEYIVSEKRPGSICVCRAYDEDTQSLLCVKSKLWFDIHAATGFYKGCAPVYLPFRQNMVGIHRQTWRCEHPDDSISHKDYPHQEKAKAIWGTNLHGPLLTQHCLLRMDGNFKKCLLINPEGPIGVMQDFVYKKLCIFGQKTMHVGDKLNNFRYGNNSCITCTCEVPPVPTCILRQNISCDKLYFALNRREEIDYLSSRKDNKSTNSLNSEFRLQNAKKTWKTSRDKECDIRDCLGPLAHYKSLNCTPEYKDNDCCAWHYNCDHLYERTNTAQRHGLCYYNGREYDIADRIEKRDKSICERNCVCEEPMNDDYIDFSCTSSREALKGPFTGCWRKPLEQCLPTAAPCHIDPMKYVCNIDGKTYSNGEYLTLTDKPNLLCICEAEFPVVSIPTQPTSQNLRERFRDCLVLSQTFANVSCTSKEFVKCTSSNKWADVHAAYYFYKNCAPIYIPGDQIHLEYHWNRWRCEQNNDFIILGNRSLLDPKIYDLMDARNPPRFLANWHCDYDEHCILVNPEGPPGIIKNHIHRQLCRFGQKTMIIGDRLNNITYADNGCVVCTCEVPPVPTCMLLITELCLI